MEFEGYHLILGNGKLSKALVKEFFKHNIRFEVYGRERFNFPMHRAFFPGTEKPVCIWNTIGAGSVEDAKQDFQKHIDAHISLTNHLMDLNVPQIHFSSDYAEIENGGHKSLYGLSKYCLEQMCKIKSHGHVRCVRVTSLFNDESGIINTLSNKMLSDKIVRASVNEVAPTHVEDLARFLVANFQEIFRQSSYPVIEIRGQSIRVCDLAFKIKQILTMGGYKAYETDVVMTEDKERPLEFIQRSYTEIIPASRSLEEMVFKAVQARSE